MTKKMTKKDWIIVSIITVIYAIVSFINLGSVSNPQTFWKTTGENESIILKLENETKVAKMRYFMGADVSKFNVSVSKDNQNYSETFEIGDTGVFTWNDYSDNERFSDTFMYIKIVSTDKEKYFGEIVLYDENDNKLNLTAETENAKTLIDEQESVPIRAYKSYENHVF